MQELASFFHSCFLAIRTSAMEIFSGKFLPMSALNLTIKISITQKARRNKLKPTQRSIWFRLRLPLCSFWTEYCPGLLSLSASLILIFFLFFLFFTLKFRVRTIYALTVFIHHELFQVAIRLTDWDTNFIVTSELCSGSLLVVLLGHLN